MTNQRTGNASILFHNHPLFLPTVLYVERVPVNEHRRVTSWSSKTPQTVLQAR